MKKPYYIYSSKREVAGKVKTYFRYTITEASGLPEYICSEHTNKGIKARNKTQAGQLVYELIQDLGKGDYKNSKVLSFGEYSKDFYLSGTCPLERAAESEGRRMGVSYLKEYRNIYLAHIKTDRILSSLIIKDITQGDLLRMRERLVHKLGVTAGARKSFKIVKQIISYAAARGDIPYNPGSGMKDIKDRPRERGVVSMDEVKRLFPHEGIGPWMNDQDSLAFRLVYSCGLRKGELLGLRWASVLFDRSAIIVTEALNDREHALGDPKKGKHRGCPVPHDVMERLKKWQGETKFPEPEDFVFCYQKRFRNLAAGTHFSGTWWIKRFNTALDNLKIDRVGRNITPHSFRHSVNTHLQDKGYSREKLRQTLGWTSSAVQDIYTHGDSMDHSGQAALVNEILTSRGE